MPSTQDPRYGLVAVTLHWLIAVLIIAAFLIGLDFPNREPGKPPPFKPLGPLHTVFGISVLALSLLRLLWRLLHRPPPHPPSMKRWEVWLANATHAAFYVLIIAMPLSGWMMVSAWKNARSIALFNLFDLPPFPLGAAEMSEAAVTNLHEVLTEVHSVLTAQILPAMLLLHVGAVIKHHVFDKEKTIRRMLPARRGSPPR